MSGLIKMNRFIIVMKRTCINSVFSAQNRSKVRTNNHFYLRSVKKVNIRRGDIYYADLSPVVGSEQGGIRPVLIVQNDVGNRFSPTVIAAAINQPKVQGQFADPYSAGLFFHRSFKRFHCPVGAGTDN